MEGTRSVNGGLTKVGDVDALKGYNFEKNKNPSKADLENKETEQIK